MNNKWFNSTLNCKAYPSSEDVSIDHRMVTAKICLSLRRNAALTTKIALYDWSLLNNKDISNKYTITLRNIFNARQEISKTLTSNDEYENFINAYIEVVPECITTNLRTKHRVPWETFAVKKKHNDVKTASLCNRRNSTPTLRNLRKHQAN